VSFASYAHAGTAAVTPALAACSKALVETMTKTETLPAYTVKAPSTFFSDLVDPNAFTVYAHHAKTKQLMAKASCKATPAGEIVSFKTIPLKS
jgi:3-hydroxymyristoyl/3-hydroxydecanoyl-(acyl carrier protein) dehydratase